MSFISGIFSGIETKIIVVLIIVLALTGLGGYILYKVDSHKISNLNNTIQNQKTQLSLDKSSIDNLKQSQKTLEDISKIQQKNLKKLNEQFNSLQSQSHKLSKELARHNLDNLAAQKPGLIEYHVNKATEALLKELTTLSEQNGPQKAPPKK